MGDFESAMIVELTEKQASKIVDNLDMLNTILERFQGADKEDLNKIILMFIINILI